MKQVSSLVWKRTGVSYTTFLVFGDKPHNKSSYVYCLCFVCSDVVGMVSYAPLFVNINDTRYVSLTLVTFSFHLRMIYHQDVRCFVFLLFFRWLPDAIFFNSSHLYGTPSYWVQQFFTESSGATLLSSTLQGDSSYVEASAISFKTNGSDYIQIKVFAFVFHFIRYECSDSDEKNVYCRLLTFQT